MSTQDLYSELDLGFRPEERALFFKEMIATARDYKTVLGGEGAEPDEISEQIQALLNELNAETAEFSPVLEVFPLRKKNFADHDLEVPPHLADRMRNHKFYLLHVPITLVPKPGWGFIQMDCILEFNPDRPPAERPVAYQLFPKEEWESVIQAEQGLRVGLDENFEFKTPPILLPGIAQAGVGFGAGGTARLILGPFNYNIRRPKILSRGIGNVKVRWRLEGEESFEREEPRLGIVLQVPKDLNQVVIIGVLKASKRFHPFTAHLRHLLQYVRERTKNFFEQGAPLAHEGAWDISAQL